MIRHNVTLTAAPGRVFMRTGASFVELEPGEALRLADELRSCVTTSIGASDGTGLLWILGASR